MSDKKPAANELRIQRVFRAPVDLVWKAWTELDHVHQWWGPRGFTLTTHHKELRPGGTWKYTMHGPDGTDYPNITLYHEVEKHARLVYDHGATENTPPLFRVRVNFKEVNGQTHMDMTMTLESAEAAERIKGFIRQAGGNSTWDRLAEHIDHQVTGQQRFVINRTFAASIEQVFKLWTEPEHLSRWLPPQGFTMQYRRAEIRPGGVCVYSMANADRSVIMYGRCLYHEITPPTRIVYIQEFCDADEKLSSHPALPNWPASMKTIITLVAEAADSTRVSVEWEPGPDSTPEEVRAFVEHRSGMTMGWTGSFNKLDEVIGREGF
ncbi:MAG TPA: SRPBCC family protein [Pseudobdellovibrionaceae bacterium]|nr:SRPBCC family protein [Pseudobdellovibrionaceae bacterium]